MESSGKTKSSGTNVRGSEKVGERQDEATSKETVSDLEHDQKLPDSSSDKTGEGAVPSPDGQIDDNRTDGTETGGPM